MTNIKKFFQLAPVLWYKCSFSYSQIFIPYFFTHEFFDTYIKVLLKHAKTINI